MGKRRRSKQSSGLFAPSKWSGICGSGRNDIGANSAYIISGKSPRSSEKVFIDGITLMPLTLL
jgi:hypothetical protein